MKPRETSTQEIVDDIFNDPSQMRYPCFVDLKEFWDKISELEFSEGGYTALDEMILDYIRKYDREND